MADAVLAGVILLVVGPVLAGLPVLAARARRGDRRRRGGGAGSLMGPFEEMWHPAAARARAEVEVAEERPAPRPSPGDRLRRRWRLPTGR